MLVDLLGLQGMALIVIGIDTFNRGAAAIVAGLFAMGSAWALARAGK